MSQERGAGGLFVAGNQVGRQFIDEQLDVLVDSYCDHRALRQNVTLPDGTTILAESCNPTLLIFTVKSKMRAIYGDKVDQTVKQEDLEIDYTKLSDAALKEIASARIKS